MKIYGKIDGSLDGSSTLKVFSAGSKEELEASLKAQQIAYSSIVEIQEISPSPNDPPKKEIGKSYLGFWVGLCLIALINPFDLSITAFFDLGPIFPLHWLIEIVSYLSEDFAESIFTFFFGWTLWILSPLAMSLIFFCMGSLGNKAKLFRRKIRLTPVNKVLLTSLPLWLIHLKFHLGIYDPSDGLAYHFWLPFGAETRPLEDAWTMLVPPSKYPFPWYFCTAISLSPIFFTWIYNPLKAESSRVEKQTGQKIKGFVAWLNRHAN